MDDIGRLVKALAFSSIALMPANVLAQEKTPCDKGITQFVERLTGHQNAANQSRITKYWHVAIKKTAGRDVPDCIVQGAKERFKGNYLIRDRVETSEYVKYTIEIKPSELY